MNIFVLDSNPKKAAEYHCDKHVVKMIVESAQILSTACHALNYKYDQTNLYKPTHRNHPCVKWVCESKKNFEWLLDLSQHLTKQYTMRYNKIHKTETVLSIISSHYNSLNFNIDNLTPFAQAMPKQYHSSDTILSYRNYYKNDKKHFAKWKLGNIPDWFKS